MWEKRETTRIIYRCARELCTLLGTSRWTFSLRNARCYSDFLRTGWKETVYTDAKVFLTKSSRGMRRSRSSDVLLSALHSFHLRENYDLCEIKLRCPNWSLLMWSISEVSSVFLTGQKWDVGVRFKTVHLSLHFYFFLVLNISFISYSRLTTLKEGMTRRIICFYSLWTGVPVWTHPFVL